MSVSLEGTLTIWSSEGTGAALKSMKTVWVRVCQRTCACPECESVSSDNSLPTDSLQKTCDAALLQNDSSWSYEAALCWAWPLAHFARWLPSGHSPGYQAGIFLALPKIPVIETGTFHVGSSYDGRNCCLPSGRKEMWQNTHAVNSPLEMLSTVFSFSNWPVMVH